LREHHGVLLDIVCRLVGTVSDAEDAVRRRTRGSLASNQTSSQTSRDR
jgi:hypothetical protein